jgi:uncharacterized protein (DUF697 family)
MDELKPGYQTSEFIGKVAVQALVLGVGLFHKSMTPEQAAVIVAGLEAVYVAGRSIVKAVRSIQSVNPVPALAAIPAAPAVAPTDSPKA